MRTNTYQATYTGPADFYASVQPGDVVTVVRDEMRDGSVYLNAFRVLDGARQATLRNLHQSDLAPLTPADAVKSYGISPEPGASDAEIAAILADLTPLPEPA